MANIKPETDETSYRGQCDKTAEDQPGVDGSTGDLNADGSSQEINKNGTLKPNDTVDSRGKKRKGKKTRGQKRRERNNKLRSEQQEASDESKENQQGYDDRVIIKENANLVKFYKLQSFISENEFDEFMEGLRTTLPASFRINTFDYGQAKFLRKLVQGSEFREFIECVTSDQKDLSPVLEPLSWYPNKLAWQMNITRVDLKKSTTLQKLHKFIMAETDNGYISRQESVSMIPPLLLDIKLGQNILDMCAAPGSKTAQLIEYLKLNIHDISSDRAQLQKRDRPTFDDGLVVANDVDNKRCYMLVHQSNRLNSPNCVIINDDASKFPKLKTLNADGVLSELKFDRILCDAPCSGDGTIRKNPDVWRKWSIGNANNFHGLQAKILRRGVELLKKDGLIVYSTCSMNPIEDEAVVASLLRQCQGRLELVDCSNKLTGLKHKPGVHSWVVMNRDMEVVSTVFDVKPDQRSQMHQSLFQPSIGEAAEYHLERCIRILPHLQNTGAFFVAVLRKLTHTLPWEDDADATSVNIEKLEKKINGAGDTRNKVQKKRRFGGFKEGPFLFMEKDDKDWLKIKDFYGLSEGFPVEQLVHRCPSGKKRTIALVSKATRAFMLANREEPDRTDFVKIINGGLKVFAKVSTDTGFRICQDGINEILPYVKEDIKVPVTKDDLRLLLMGQSCPTDQLSSKEHLKEKVSSGSVILIYKYEVESDSENGQLCTHELPLVAWRGRHNVALYVSKTYRVHLWALIEEKIGDIDSHLEEADVRTKAEKEDHVKEQELEQGINRDLDEIDDIH